VIAAPVTKTIRDIPTELRLDASDGMPAECVASFDNLRVVAKAFLVERQCTLDPVRLAFTSAT
jgi:mRNA interferase MazF